MSNQSTFQPVSFDRSKYTEFAKELNKEVKEYLKSAGGNFGGWRFMIKIPVMFGMYLIPYFLILFGVVTSLPLLVLMYVIMGFGMAFIGLALMHDANHGSASENPTINKLIGLSINFLGGNATCWKVQHNVLHHTYTNIDEYDEDISPAPILRFSPYAKRFWIHRFQHIYASFFYGLMTVLWVTTKDFKQLARYERRNLLITQNTTYKSELIQLIIWKIFYNINMFVPFILFTDFKIWEMFIGFFSLHFVAGITLALIFQPAHVTEEMHFVDAHKTDYKVDQSPIVHQLETTMNFATESKWFTWMVGGLNHQVEHHLYPQVSHVHYHSISKIVKRVADKYGIKHHEAPSFFKALSMHFGMLKALGNKDFVGV